MLEKVAKQKILRIKRHTFNTGIFNKRSTQCGCTIVERSWATHILKMRVYHELFTSTLYTSKELYSYGLNCPGVFSGKKVTKQCTIYSVVIVNPFFNFDGTEYVLWVTKADQAFTLMQCSRCGDGLSIAFLVLHSIVQTTKVCIELLQYKTPVFVKPVCNRPEHKTKC